MYAGLKRKPVQLPALQSDNTLSSPGNGPTSFPERPGGGTEYNTRQLRSVCGNSEFTGNVWEIQPMIVAGGFRLVAEHEYGKVCRRERAWQCT